jgi:hypothetical protein
MEDGKDVFIFNEKCSNSLLGKYPKLESERESERERLCVSEINLSVFTSTKAKGYPYFPFSLI